MLERAAIVGREFTRRAVEALWESEDTGAASLPDGVTRRRLVQPERAAAAGDDAFRFDHVLIRDAAYASLTKGERRGARQGWRAGSTSVASWTRSSATTSSRQRSTMVELGEPERLAAAEAAHKLGRAGRRDLWSADLSAAVGLLTRAEALLPPDQRPLELELDLGTAAKSAGDVNRAAEVLGEVAARARDAGDRRVELTRRS